MLHNSMAYTYRPQEVVTAAGRPAHLEKHSTPTHDAYQVNSTRSKVMEHPEVIFAGGTPWKRALWQRRGISKRYIQHLGSSGEKSVPTLENRIQGLCWFQGWSQIVKKPHEMPAGGPCVPQP